MNRNGWRDQIIIVFNQLLDYSCHVECCLKYRLLCLTQVDKHVLHAPLFFFKSVCVRKMGLNSATPLEHDVIQMMGGFKR